MKSLNKTNSKILFLLALLLLANFSGFSQTRKVTPKKTAESKKVVEVVISDKRPVTVYLKDGNELKGTFITASTEGIQILIVENTMTLKWKDIKQIIFTDDNKEIATKIEDSPIREVEINKKPLEDLVAYVRTKVQNDRIDLTKPVLVVMEGTLNEYGKLDLRKSKFVKAEGDQEMINIAKNAIEALSDSGYFGYLKQYGVDNITFTLQQDENEMRAITLSDQKTEERARTISSGFATLITGVLMFDKNGIKKLGSDERTLLNNMKTTSNGKQFVLTVILPKSMAQEMINRKLEE